MTSLHYKSIDRLFVIIPVRDRESELNALIRRLTEVFKYQNIDFSIFIVEQTKYHLFNKGKLINAGVNEVLKAYPTARNFVFHDVDIQPQDNTIIDYSSINSKVRHPYGVNLYLGGIVFMDIDSFKEVNGFSNEYWGWGFEDTDLQLRLRLFDIDINRDNFIPRRSTPRISDPISENTGSKTDSVNRQVYTTHEKLYRENRDRTKHDGLTTCDYHVVNRTKQPNLTRILVRLNY